VPTIIDWPGQAASGAVSDEPIITHDLYPTILEMTGVADAVEPTQPVDGVSLTPILKNPEASLDREAIYWHYPHYHRGGATPYSAMRAGQWRLIHFYEDDRYELYNLEQDVDESNNLIDDRPQKANQLKQRLEAWRDEVDAQPPRANPLYNGG
jgi:arylsulfatase A-like enzyme